MFMLMCQVHVYGVCVCLCVCVWCVGDKKKDQSGAQATVYSQATYCRISVGSKGYSSKVLKQTMTTDTGDEYTLQVYQ